MERGQRAGIRSDDFINFPGLKAAEVSRANSMTKTNKQDADAHASSGKKKPGRKASGEGREVIVRRAVAEFRERQRQAGLKNLRVYVRPETTEGLAALKLQFGLENIGEVIDHLVADTLKKSSKD